METKLTTKRRVSIHKCIQDGCVMREVKKQLRVRPNRYKKGVRPGKVIMYISFDVMTKPPAVSKAQCQTLEQNKGINYCFTVATSANKQQKLAAFLANIYWDCDLVRFNYSNRCCFRKPIISSYLRNTLIFFSI